MELSLDSQNFISSVLNVIKSNYSDSVDFFGVYCFNQGNSTVIQPNELNFVIVKDDESRINRYYALTCLGGGIVKVKSQTWEEYGNHIGRASAYEILLVKTLYFKDADAQEKYLRIKRLAENYLLSPLNLEKVEKIAPLVTDLKICNSDVNTAEIGLVKYHAIKLLNIATRLLCELNCGYFRYKNSERRKDIETLTILPQNFIKNYTAVLIETDEKIIKKLTNAITLEVSLVFEKVYKIYNRSKPTEKACFATKILNASSCADKSEQGKITSAISSFEIAEGIENLKRVGIKLGYKTADLFVSGKNAPNLSAIKQTAFKDYSFKDFDIITVDDLSKIDL